MAKRYISVLSTDPFTLKKLPVYIKEAKSTAGYIGSRENELLDFIKNHTLGDHIVLVKPNESYEFAFNHLFLRKYAQVNTIVFGPKLPIEVRSLVQSNHISGYYQESDLTPDAILEIIRFIRHKGYCPNTSIPEECWKKRPVQLQRYAPPEFTIVEKDILCRVCHGWTQAEIAKQLNISLSTVKKHLENIRYKCRAATTNEVVALSVVNHWVDIKLGKHKNRNPFFPRYAN